MSLIIENNSNWNRRHLGGQHSLQSNVMMVQCLDSGWEEEKTFCYNFPYHQHVRATCGRIVGISVSNCVIIQLTN